MRRHFTGSARVERKSVGDFLPIKASHPPNLNSMASEDNLRAWYTASGLKGKKLEGAMRASEAAEVEDVDDLRMMLGVGQLEGVFSSATLSYIMTALKASAHPEPEPEAAAQLATTHRLTDHDCSSEGLLSPLGGFVLLKLLARPRCAT